MDGGGGKEMHSTIRSGNLLRTTYLVTGKGRTIYYGVWSNVSVSVLATKTVYGLHLNNNSRGPNERKKNRPKIPIGDITRLRNTIQGD